VKEEHPYDLAHQQIEATIKEKKAAFANDLDKLVLDSLIADRKAKRVELLGCATAIGATDPLEFFITPASSGKDYESLVIVWAKPSELHKALEFIGLKPGRPINFSTNHHWTRGPRVIVTFNYEGKSVRVEEMAIDTEQQKPLPLTGMVFTGSFSHTDEEGKRHYAADVVDSKAIAPNYNDPVAVLDMPRRLAQSEVYGFQRPNPAHAIKLGTPVTVTIEPATGDDAVAIRDLKLSVTMKGDSLAYAITEADQSLVTATTLPELLAGVAKIADGKSDLFTTPSIDPATPITDLRKMYALLMSVEQDRGLKLDPPAKGELFHRAFFPHESWRDRENRLGEPWELFLARENGKIVARLERNVELFEPERRMELQKFDVPTPDAFVKTINEKQSQWSQVVFVYPPKDLTYGELMTWVRPALETYPRVFVFPAEPAAPTTQP
jgi:hypothetical protein